MNKSFSPPFYHIPSSLSKVIPRIVRPLMRKHGFPDVDIFTDWPKIIGERLAKHTLPLKITVNKATTRQDKLEGKSLSHNSKGVLHIQTSSAVALELQHAHVQIIERINGYFGYCAVNRIKLIHVPRVRSPQTSRKASTLRDLAPLEERQLEHSIGDIPCAHLREAIKELGTMLLRNTPEPKKSI